MVIFMKSSALRIRIEPQLHEEFLALCKSQDIPAAQVIRSFMRNYIEGHVDAFVQPDLFPMNDTDQEIAADV